MDLMQAIAPFVLVALLGVAPEAEAHSVRAAKSAACASAPEHCRRLGLTGMQELYAENRFIANMLALRRKHGAQEARTRAGTSLGATPS